MLRKFPIQLTIILFSVNDRSTLESAVNMWSKEWKTHKPGSPYILVGVNNQKYGTFKTTRAGSEEGDQSLTKKEIDWLNKLVQLDTWNVLHILLPVSVMSSTMLVL